AATGSLTIGRVSWVREKVRLVPSISRTPASVLVVMVTTEKPLFATFTVKFCGEANRNTFPWVAPVTDDGAATVTVAEPFGPELWITSNVNAPGLEEWVSV